MATISNGNPNNGHAGDGQNPAPAPAYILEITIFALTRQLRISVLNGGRVETSVTLCYPPEPPGTMLTFDERYEILSLSGTFLPSLTAPLLGFSRLSVYLGLLVSLRSGLSTLLALGPVTVITALITNAGLPPPLEQGEDGTSSGEMLSPASDDSPTAMPNGNGHMPHDMFPPPN